MTDEPIRILLVEDEPAHAELVRRAFEVRGDQIQLHIVASISEARANLAASAALPHLIIADWRLPDGEGMELLSAGRENWTPPVMIMTSHGNERVAVEALKAGALDYVVKSETTLLDMPHLAERVLREWNVRVERTRMQQALHASEEKFNKAFRSSPVALSISDTVTQHYLEINDAFARLTGYLRDELVGRPAHELNLWVDAQEYARVMQQLARQGMVHDYEIRFQNRGGEIRSAVVSLEIVDLNGVPCLLTTIYDITDRKRSEEALRQYAERLALLHEIDQAILAAKSIEDIADAALSRIQRSVPSWRVKVMLFDFDQAEAVVEAYYCEGARLPPGERVPLSALGSIVTLRPGELYVINDLTEMLTPSANQLRQIADGARSSVDAPLIVLGQLIGVLSMDATQWDAFHGEVVDVAREVADQLAVAIQNARLLEQTQRHAKELEQRVAERTRELATANERLTELDRLKSKFVSDVSHELRTPIANLKLHVELLEHGRPEKHEHYMTVVKQQARRLGQLVDDILNLSRLEMGKQRAVLGPVDLNFVVEQIVAAHQPRAEATGVSLSFTPWTDLPPVRGEVNQLAQVVTNLVINALNYTPSGSVRVTTVHVAPSACLQIEDTGIGIDADDLPNIFDRFYRGRRSQRVDTPGTGLGLAIVKEIIELHEGRIEVSSLIKQGTIFKIWLPLYQDV